jgi:hypothetical protein
MSAYASTSCTLAATPPPPTHTIIIHECKRRNAASSGERNWCHVQAIVNAIHQRPAHRDVLKPAAVCTQASSVHAYTTHVCTSCTSQQPQPSRRRLIEGGGEVCLQHCCRLSPSPPLQNRAVRLILLPWLRCTALALSCTNDAQCSGCQRPHQSIRWLLWKRAAKMQHACSHACCCHAGLSLQQLRSIHCQVDSTGRHCCCSSGSSGAAHLRMLTRMLLAMLHRQHTGRGGEKCCCLCMGVHDMCKFARSGRTCRTCRICRVKVFQTHVQRWATSWAA